MFLSTYDINGCLVQLSVFIKMRSNIRKRLSDIEGLVYTRSCRTEMKTFYFVYPEAAISVLDTSKYP